MRNREPFNTRERENERENALNVECETDFCASLVLVKTL